MSRVLREPPAGFDSPAGLYIGRLAPSSARTTVRLLNLAATVLAGKPMPWWEFAWISLTHREITELRDKLKLRYKAATVNAALTAVRGILKEACLRGMITPNVYFSLMEIQGPARESKKTHPPLHQEDLNKLLPRHETWARPAADRDTALLALVYGTGLSSTAVVELNLEDLNLAQGVLTSNQKEREVRYVLGAVTSRVQPWLDARGKEAGPLFVGVDKSGRFHQERLNPQVVHDVLAKRSQEAGLKGVSIAAIRALALAERQRLCAAGWRDHDADGRIFSLPV
jgi:integrase/recombinase XerD